MQRSDPGSFGREGRGASRGTNERGASRGAQGSHDMTRVALLASQQPVEALTLGALWAEAGDEVTVVLLDGATAILRAGHAAAAALATARDAGVTVWAHDTALQERAVDAGAAARVVGLDRVAALIGDTASKVQWW